MAHFKPLGYAGTPNFPRVILEKGTELDADLSLVKSVLVGGGALLLPLRQAYQARGISVLQSCGAVDVGNIAYETRAHEGVVLEEGVIVEIVCPYCRRSGRGW
jgi:phenylacetate-CoA ligase